MRIEKRGIQNIGGMEMHNERKTDNHSNEDINKELTHLNYNLIECKSYKKSIQKELEKRYKSDRKIRVDAVLAVEVLFTSDNEFFKSLNTEQEKLYFEKSLEFLKDFVGEKNVISATVHRDEKTPHLHAVFTPITDDGRLHFKSFINGKNDMIKLQDNYYKYISKYFPELERGKSADKTQRKHLNVAEYKEVSNLESELKEKKAELVQVKESIEDKKTELQIAKNNLQNEKNEVEELIKKLTSKKEKIKENFSLEEEKFLKIKDIKNTVVEKTGMFDKEVKITMNKDEYNSLLTYAIKGEEFYKKTEDLKENLKFEFKKLEIEKNELETKKKNFEKELEEIGTKISKLETENKELKNSNDELTLEKNKLEKNKEIEEFCAKKLEEFLIKNKYMNMFDVSNFKIEAKIEYNRLEKEKIEEDKSRLEIKGLVTKAHVDDYLKGLYEKGFDNLNKVDKEFVKEKANYNDLAKAILNTSKEKLEEEKTEKENNNVWENENSSDNSFEIGR